MKNSKTVFRNLEKRLRQAREMRQKELNICVHAEEDCPTQARFIQTLLELEGNRISGWKGYKTVGSGYTVCVRRMPLSFKKLHQICFEELSRLRKLEAGIQEALSRVTA